MGQIRVNGILLESAEVDIEDDIDEPETRKYIKVSPEVGVTVCAVTKDISALDMLAESEFDDHFVEPNRYWRNDPSHDMARLKVYKRDPESPIPMQFLGHDANDGYGELQIRIKEKIVRYRNNQKMVVTLRPILIGRHRSFDTRIGEFGEWTAETRPIQPKKNQDPVYYLPFRFYHADHLPKMPGGWHWEPVHISIGGKEFYKIDNLSWKEKEITFTITPLDKDSPEIPEHIRGATQAAQEELALVLRRTR